MGLFSRKKAGEDEPVAEPDDFDPIDNIALLAMIRFRVRGLEVDVAEDSAGLDSALVDSSGTNRYALRGLIEQMLPLSPDSDEYHATLLQSVDSMIDMIAAPSIASFTDDELAASVRIRLLPDSFPPARQEYAQRVAPGLVTVLCIDHPTSIAYINDSELAGRDVHALFDAGFRNVMAEPIDQVEEPVPGIHLLSGESLFIATKAIGLGSLLGTVLPPAPLGVIVGMPHRHAMFVHVLTGPESIDVLGRLASAVAASAAEQPEPARVSGSIYYWKDHVFEQAGGLGEDGSIHIWPSERLTAVLRPAGA